jgi:Tfp pilus assembly protein PilN
MAELTEQQGHLSSILAQQKELANEINQLQAQITNKKELFQKTQGVVEYLTQVGVKLPEEETEPTTAPTEVVK